MGELILLLKVFGLYWRVGDRNTIGCVLIELIPFKAYTCSRRIALVFSCTAALDIVQSFRNEHNQHPLTLFSLVIRELGGGPRIGSDVFQIH